RHENRLETGLDIVAHDVASWSVAGMRFEYRVAAVVEHASGPNEPLRNSGEPKMRSTVRSEESGAGSWAAPLPPSPALTRTRRHRRRIVRGPIKWTRTIATAETARLPDAGTRSAAWAAHRAWSAARASGCCG